MTTSSQPEPLLKKVRFALNGPNLPAGETLWAEQAGDHIYKLRNATCFTDGYADGDVVRCAVVDGWETIIGMEQDSGNGNLLIMFAESSTEPQRIAVNREMTSVGCNYECFSSHLYAFTVPPYTDVPFSQIVAYLDALVEKRTVSGYQVTKPPAQLQ